MSNRLEGSETRRLPKRRARKDNDATDLIAASHEILLGQVPYDSWLARHLSKRVRPWVEAAQAFEKQQLGLSKFFLNSLRLTWIMCLLADMVVLLRAQALLCEPTAPDPLAELNPQQMELSGGFCRLERRSSTDAPMVFPNNPADRPILPEQSRRFRGIRTL